MASSHKKPNIQKSFNLKIPSYAKASEDKALILVKKHSYIGIAFIILVLGIWVVWEWEQRTNKELVTFEKVANFSFVNQYGDTITNDFYKNKVYLVKFFFTTCPGICPKMNANMQKLQNKFKLRADFGIASISISPNDTPGVLKNYANKLGVKSKNWHFLTGDIDTIYAFSNQAFKLYAAENEEAEGGFEHSGLFALVDKKGFIRSRALKQNGYETPIKYYDGLNTKHIQMLKEDVETLLKQK